MSTYAYEAIAVADSVKTLTAAKLSKPETFGRLLKDVYITVEDAPIRFTLDGTTPTTTVGHLMIAGSSFTLNSEDAKTFQAIRSTAVSASIKCSYSV